MAKAGRSRVPVKLEAAGDTHIGGRTHNEDAILLRPDLNLFLVADGAGGQNAGNVAASLAITTIAHFFEQTKGGAESLPLLDGLGLHTAARRLAAAVQEANKEILAIAKGSDKHRGMGTTIVATQFDLEHRLMHLAYVGDSRCYRLREGRLEQLSHDHSLINDVLELRPNISDERVRKLPQNVITRALGMMENLRVSMRTFDVAHGDRYLMCSDGLSDNVDDAQIHEALALDIGCDEQVALFTSMALEAGASDNVAALIVDCALPHMGTKARTSTRPIKKKSRPKLPRIDVRVPAQDLKAGITEESVPEIVLYDRPEARDSSPMIHVVPEASRSPDVMQALKGVMPEDDQVTKEYESPLAALEHIADPTGGEPPIRSEPPTQSKPPSLPPIPEGGTTKVMETDHAALRQAASELPDPLGEDDPDDPPTRAFPRKAPVVEAKPKKPRIPKKAKSKAKSKAKKKPLSMPQEARSGRAARTTMKPKARTTLPQRPNLKGTKSSTSGGTERGGAAARQDSAVSAPRLHKPDIADEPTEVRTGDTQSPPGTSDSPPPIDSPIPSDSAPPPRLRVRRQKPPPIPIAGRTTLTGPAPAKKGRTAESDDDDGLPMPPQREPFDTSDFTNDSVPCHACGSIIMRSADICMYCGAPTGFVLKD